MGREDELYREAVDYRIDNECKGFQALSVSKFRSLKPQTICRMVTKKLEQLGFENAKTSRDDQKLLTRAEELEFREWLITENKTCAGKGRDEFGERLCEVLKKRQELFTKSRGRKAQALSTAVGGYTPTLLIL